MQKSFAEKFWKLMRICSAQFLIVLTFCGISLAHTNYAQILDKQVSISLTDVPFNQALKQLEQAADIKFAYSISQLEKEGKVAIQAQNKSLRDVLDEIFTPRNIKYTVHEKEGTIALKKFSELEDDQSYLPVNEKASSRMQISGIVLEASTRQPMAGVNIVVKLTARGTTTDSNGQFVIEAEVGERLIFSFIGYATIEIPVGTKTNLEVTLEEDIGSLKEVVVYSTGYDDISAERTTGSFTQLDKDLLERNVGSDVTSRLNGIAQSLLIDQRSGSPNFNIRGRSTILANDQPLIVVDNFPYQGDLNTINPNDIENITILKDAAAASIWGVRAGNGVIVITTKKGALKQPMRVTANTNITIGQKPDLFYENRISTNDFIDTEVMLFNSGFYDGAISDATNPALTPGVELLVRHRNGEITEDELDAQLNALRNIDTRRDIEKNFYQTSINQQYAINVSGGLEKYSYYFSAGYDNNRDNRIGNRYGRLTLNSQQTFRPTEKLAFDMRLVYAQSQNDFNNALQTLRMGSKNLYPYAKLVDDSGQPLPIVSEYRSDFVDRAVSQGFLNWQLNPIEELSLSDNSSEAVNIRVAPEVRYEVFKGLTFSAKYQYETQAVNGTDFRPAESYYTRNLINRYSQFDGTKVTTNNIPVGGILNLTNSQLKSHNFRAQANYDALFDNHQITALAGVEVRQSKIRGSTDRYYGYDPVIGSSSPVNYRNSYLLYPNNVFATIPNSLSISEITDRFRSYFANLSYTYGGRYTLSASARVDQSNLFGVRSNQRSSPLWSIGGKWNVTGEKFINVPLSVLALRVTYGYNGNIDQRVTALTTAAFLTSGFSQRPAAELRNPPNPDLRWEKTGMLNIGVDFGLKNNRVSGSIEYYSRRSTDLMGQGPIDPTKGFSIFTGNIADMKGHGWDLQLNTLNVNGAIKWNTNLLFSYTIDEVTNYKLKPTVFSQYFQDASIGRSSSQYTPTEGKPLFAIFSFPWAGLDPDTGDPLGYKNGEPSKDYAAIYGTGTVDSLIYHGPALAPYFGALRNTVQYKRWSLSVNITYRFGYYFRARSINYYNLYNFNDGHGDFANRWLQPGDEIRTHVPSQVYPVDVNRDSFYERSSVLIEKGDNIRLQDIQLSYEIKNMKIGKITVPQLQVYGYINNVGLLWKANKVNIDPDFPTSPLPRTVALGMRFTF